MEVDPSNDCVNPSDGVPLAAILASVFFTTRYLLWVARIFSRKSVSWATVIPLNCATIRFVASARSFLSAFSSFSFLFFGFMRPLIRCFSLLFYWYPGLLGVERHEIKIDARTHG